jgi:hypothetical protein
MDDEQQILAEKVWDQRRELGIINLSEMTHDLRTSQIADIAKTMSIDQMTQELDLYITGEPLEESTRRRIDSLIREQEREAARERTAYRHRNVTQPKGAAIPLRDRVPDGHGGYRRRYTHEH